MNGPNLPSRNKADELEIYELQYLYQYLGWTRLDFQMYCEWRKDYELVKTSKLVRKRK